MKLNEHFSTANQIKFSFGCSYKTTFKIISNDRSLKQDFLNFNFKVDFSFI